jgi:antitoxin component HigA of HigAB toxin-antitoxin module
MSSHWLPEKAPSSYKELLGLYPPRKIHDKAAYQQALKVVDWLALRAETKDQEDFLDLLSDLVDGYESKRFPQEPAASPIELLNYLVEENEITTRELGSLLGIDHSAAARILKSQRSITPEHAQKLGERFAIRPSRFLGLE